MCISPERRDKTFDVIRTGMQNIGVQTQRVLVRLQATTIHQGITDHNKPVLTHLNANIIAFQTGKGLCILCDSDSCSSDSDLDSIGLYRNIIGIGHFI